MNKNKLILKNCPNFYRIINFEPMAGDNITDKLINIYQEYIFKIDVLNEEEIESVKELDRVLRIYVDDYSFRKSLQKDILTVQISKDCRDLIREFVKSIINLFYKYEEETRKIICISKWI